MNGLKMRKCEICGVKTCRMDGQKRIFMARFPLDEDRCKQWVAATGNANLIYMPIEKLNQLKYVCGKHFHKKHFKKKQTQLKKNAVPLIDIAQNPLIDDMFHSFPLHIQYVGKSDTRKDYLNDHNYCSQTDREFSTSTSELFIEIDPISKRSDNPISSTSTPEIVIENYLNGNKSQTSIPLTSTPEIVIENYLNGNKSQTTIPSTSTSEILIQTDLKGKMSKMSKKPDPSTLRNQKLMKKLAESRTLIKKLQKKVDQIENISSPILKSIIETSISNQKRKPKGKRYTELSKSVALAIYQRSPEAFKFLSTLLPMPSIRTLKTVLQNMEINPGTDL